MNNVISWKNKKRILFVAITPILLSLLLGAPLVSAVSHTDSQAGYVFTMTNSPSGNAILAYHRLDNGKISFAGSFATGGNGESGLTGTNQGGVTLSNDGSWLFAVNAGSNTISVFRVTADDSLKLKLTDVAVSNGMTPISVTIHGPFVYVLDAGNSSVRANIAGFYFSEGELEPIHGSIQPLSGVTQPAQISFNPAGTKLVVTEKSTNLIDVYKVNDDGVAGKPTINSSRGTTPFGFAFNNQGYLIVSDAGSGALTSYSVTHSGYVKRISGPVSDGQQAPCWVVITRDGKLAFTTDAHSNTISSYAISNSGSLTVLKSIAANTGKTDLDMALSSNSHYLYVFDGGANEIQAFIVHSDGTLSLLQTIPGLPSGGDGLAAR